MIVDSSWAKGAVTCNQRLLIHKMLARYSSDFVIFRELIQNAADACASHIEVHFDVDLGQDQTQHLIRRIRVRNNGRDFSEDDFGRLAKIAEGNPNADSVGQFGVGFYSVLGITDEPSVTSGGRCLVFRWEGDSLVTFTKRVDTAQVGWTEMDMPCSQLRLLDCSTGLMDHPRTLDRDPKYTIKWRLFRTFLCKALLFIKHVDTVSVFLNGACQLSVHRSTTVSKSIRPPRPVALTYVTLPGFSESEHTLTVVDERKTTTSVSFRSVTCTAQVSLSEEFHARCEHVMKKRFASTTPIQLLYSTAHGMNTNATGAQLGPLAELCPLLGEEDASTPPRLLGKVFIGIGTAQTTGSGFHVHAQFVPTIEREALDFHDPHIGAWNQELMLAAGVLARLSMDTALRDIQVSRSTSTAMRFQTAERCLVPHAFSASAPLPLVARLLSRGFFHVPEPILVPVNSPVGRHTEAKTMLVESSDTFLPAFGIDFAVGGLSMIDSGLFARAHALFLELQNRHLIGSLTLQQLFEALSRRPLSIQELASVLRWFCRVPPKTFESPQLARQWLYKLSWIHRDGTDDEGVRRLDIVKYFLDNASELAWLKDLPQPLPENVLPPEAHAELASFQLSGLLGWTALTVSTWVDSLVHHSRHFDHPKEAAEALAFICKHQASLTASNWSLLRRTACLPAVAQDRDQGQDQNEACMCRPTECFFPMGRVTPDFKQVSTTVIGIRSLTEDKHKDSKTIDLPTVTRGFLEALGVRPPGVRMLLHNHSWGNPTQSSAEIVNLLREHFQSDHVAAGDLELVRQSRCLWGVPWSSSVAPRLCLPGELHLPETAHEAQIPGLLMLVWPENVPMDTFGIKWFLVHQLQVRELPGLCTVMEAAATWKRPPQAWDPLGRPSESMSPPLVFLLKHFHASYRAAYKEWMVHATDCPSFVPCEDGTYRQPKHAVTEENPFQPTATSAFCALARRYGVDTRRDLEIPAHPEFEACIREMMDRLDRLKLRRTSDGNGEGTLRDTVVAWFTYLSKRLLADMELEKRLPSAASMQMDHVAFVPWGGNSNDQGWRKPKDLCFAASTRASDVSALDLEGLVDFVDLPLCTHPFLKWAGCMSQPTPTLIAQGILEHHARYLGSLLLKAEDKPEDAKPPLGQRITLNTHLHKPPDDIDTKSKPTTRVQRYHDVLLYLADNVSSIEASVRDQMKVRAWMLASKAPDGQVGIVSPRECFLVDHPAYERVLVAWTAPSDLQDFYLRFGCQWLSDAIRRSFTAESVDFDSPTATQLTALIAERFPLLIVDARRQRVPGVSTFGMEQLQRLVVGEARSLVVTLHFAGRDIRLDRDPSFCCGIELTETGRAQLLVRARASASTDADNVNFYDVASELARQLFVSVDTQQQHITHMIMCLTTPLDQLKAMGLPVEQILAKRSLALDAKQHVSTTANGKDETEQSGSESKSSGVDSSLTSTSHLAHCVQYTAQELKSKARRTKIVSDDCANAHHLKRTPYFTNNRMSVFVQPMDEPSNKKKTRKGKASPNTTTGGPALTAMTATTLTTEQRTQAEIFSQLLERVASIFGIAASHLNLYFQPVTVGSSRSFNQGGALFFNVQCFVQNHLVVQTSSAATLGCRWNSRAPASWLLTFCHELAHNEEHAHNQRHEALMASLFDDYFGKFVETFSVQPPDAKPTSHLPLTLPSASTLSSATQSISSMPSGTRAMQPVSPKQMGCVCSAAGGRACLYHRCVDKTASCTCTTRHYCKYHGINMSTAADDDDKSGASPSHVSSSQKTTMECFKESSLSSLELPTLALELAYKPSDTDFFASAGLVTSPSSRMMEWSPGPDGDDNDEDQDADFITILRNATRKRLWGDSAMSSLHKKQRTDDGR